MLIRTNVCVALLMAACGNSGGANEPSADIQIEALFAVPPAGVNCIQITVAGQKRTVTRSFDVAALESTAVLSLTAIPTGNALISGSAFDEACANVTVTSVATWLADALAANLAAGANNSVTLAFHTNSRVTVSGNFVPDSYTTTTFLGVAGAPGSQDGTATSNPPATFEGPNALAYDGADTIWVADRTTDATGTVILGNTIRRVSLSGRSVTTVAGSATQVGAVDGVGFATRFVRLMAVALSGPSLLIADRCSIRSMTLGPGPTQYTVSTLYGTANATNTDWVCSGQGSLGDLAIAGNQVFFTWLGASTVWQAALGPAALSPFVIAGILDSPGANDGPVGLADGGTVAGEARFTNPAGLFVDPSGTIYVGDTGLNAAQTLGYGDIRRVAGGSVATIAGSPAYTAVSADGVGGGAAFQVTRRILSDGSSLFVSDQTSVRRVDLATDAVVTIAGDAAATLPDGGVVAGETLNGPFGLARNPLTGEIYVGDQGNFVLRVLSP